MNGRKTACDILLKVETNGAYSNLELSYVLSKEEIEGRDAAFVSALVYGVLERRLTLDYIIGKHSSRRVRDIDDAVLTALRVGVYQLIYMDKIPAFSAIDETVNIVKLLRGQKSAGFANAVLRAVAEDKNAAKISVKDELTGISRAYSVSRDIVEILVRDYGVDAAKSILKASFGKPPTTIRVNTLKTDKKEILGEFSKLGVLARENPAADEAMDIENFGKINSLSFFQKGYFHIQDCASQLCAKALGAKPGERVLDICAAPGGKTFTVAEYMQNQGEIVACDLYPQRVKLIEDGAERLGISIIKTAVKDAAKYSEDLGVFDRVLCDVPCSGIGVIRRKPEIRYKTKEEIDSLVPIQKSILNTASMYVKRGGTLLYSTCTLNFEENGAVTQEFLKNHPDFTIEPLFDGSDASEKTFLPSSDKTDGFYICKFKKIR